ncbi:MAG: hypothetical protein QF733_04825 [Phycisphaerales bacterium]|nr:hypothetical protein [Phycisphaerales bacterium]
MKLMNRDTYISIMLTLTACLLTADLWARAVAGPPLLATPAAAQGSSTPRGVGSTAARAFEQRREMVSLLKDIKVELKGVRADLKAAAPPAEKKPSS